MGCIRRPIGVTFDASFLAYINSASEEQIGGADRREAAAPPRSVVCPPPVLRGANSQSVSLDWFRCTASRNQLDKACEIMDKHYGPCSVACKGRFFLSSGRSWGTGGVFFDVDGEQSAEHIVVEVPAGMLDLLGSAYRVDLVRDFMFAGFKTTRIDVALDIEGQNITVIRDISESCARGELCRQRLHEYTASMLSGEVVGEICKVGCRGGSGSGRYSRWYDKGLETASRVRGEWIRGEVELSDDVGHQAALAIADSQHPGLVMASLVVGAFELRANPDEPNLSRRPLVKFWADLVSSAGATRFVAKRLRSSLQGWTEWMSVAVVPQLKGLADACGLGVSDLLQRLLGDIPAKREIVGTEIGRAALCLVKGERWWVPLECAA